MNELTKIFETKEIPENISEYKTEKPNISYIEQTSRKTLIEQNLANEQTGRPLYLQPKHYRLIGNAIIPNGICPNMYTTTNSEGGIIKVTAKQLFLKYNNGDYTRIHGLASGRKEVDDSGHVIGKRFGGSNDINNLIPMPWKLNQGDYKYLEDYFEKTIKEGKEVLNVEWSIECKGLEYPKSIHIKWEIDGKSYSKSFKYEDYQLMKEKYI